MTVPSVTLTGRGATGLTTARPLTPPAPVSVKLGAIPPKAKPQALRLSKYVDREKLFRAVPEKVDYSDKAMASISKMLGNDQYGDCVIVGKLHSIGIWTGNDTPNVTAVATEQEAVSQYRQICGHLGRDSGCIIEEVLNVFQSKGLVCGGKTYKIDGWVSVDYDDIELIKAAHYLFGALTVGHAVPADWPKSDIWDISRSRISGYHDVCSVGYDSEGLIISSWARLYKIKWRVFTDSRIVNTLAVPLAPAWYGEDKLAPSGVDVERLREDLGKLDKGEIPDVEPGPPPTPPDPPKPPEPPAPPQPETSHWTVQGTVELPAVPGIGSGGVVKIDLHGDSISPAPHWTGQTALVPVQAPQDWLPVILEILRLLRELRS
jgi:hypothetical protein